MYVGISEYFDETLNVVLCVLLIAKKSGQSSIIYDIERHDMNCHMIQVGSQRASTMGLSGDRGSSGSQQGRDGGSSGAINYSAPHMR